MNITITRSLQRPGTIDGQISIYGRHICDCEENAATALPPGTYPVPLVNCHQYARKMPVVRLSSLPPCSSCPRRPFVGSNTRLPLVCPMLKPGNGVCQRTDGSIIVGRRAVPGCLVRPRAAFAALYERIRKTLERGKPVRLHISSNPFSPQS